jgi:hypothetical protein
MMRSYIGMRRALCGVVAGFGSGMGHVALLLRFAPLADRHTALYDKLREWLSTLPQRAGLASAHLLVSAIDPQMTREQQIRGRDATLDSVVLVTGYARDIVQSLVANELAEASLVAAGAAPGSHASGMYELAYFLEARELVGREPGLVDHQKD